MSRARRASAVAVAACLSLGVGVTGAGASRLAPSTSIANYLSAHGSTAATTYHRLLGDYRRSLARINHSYGLRVAQAHEKYLKSLARAKSASDKLQARTRYRSAVVAATTQREVELEILGSSPDNSDN